MIDSCDCIAILGCKLTHNGTSGFELRLPAEKSIRVDSSRDNLDRNYRVGIALHGDLRTVVPAVLGGVAASGADSGRWAQTEISKWKKRFAERRAASVPKTVEPDASGLVTMPEYFGELRRALPENAIVVAYCGMHQILTRRLMPINRPRGLIVPADFQSVGFGIPAAIGAKYGASERPVVAIVGDGGLAVTGFELLTAAREKLDLLAIVFCDGYLGQIRALQLSSYGREFGTVLGDTNVEQFAQSIGAEYIELRDGFPAALDAAVSMKGVRVLALHVRDTSQARALAFRRSVMNDARRIPGVNSLAGIARNWRKRLFPR